MAKIRVGVLRGGPSSEYDVSLKTGGAVLAALPQDKYEPRDIFIDRDGNWHQRGLRVWPEQVLEHIDVAFIALHGSYGEDGVVQRLLERYAIPFTGTGSLGSAVGMNKVLSKERIKAVGIKTPVYRVVTEDGPVETIAYSIFKTFLLPCVVKPITGGSSIGVVIARSFPELIESLTEAFEKAEKVLVEEYIRGREATVGIIDSFRNEDMYALPPVEIVPEKGRQFFDYEAKYNGESEEHCPGNFTFEEKADLERLARDVHKTLGLRHYSRSDFIVTPRRGAYFLEVNTLPGLTPSSLVPKALDVVGCSFPQFLDHVVTLALTKK